MRPAPLARSNTHSNAHPLFRPSAILAATLAAVAALSATLPAQAQIPADNAARTVQIDLPAQPLQAALLALGRQTGLQLAFAPQLVAGRQAPAISGHLDRWAALERLLAGTDLAYRRTGTDSALIEARAAAAAGASFGTTTETAPSLTSVAVVASRAPRSIDEIPNTVWIIDSAEIETQSRAGVPLKEMLGLLVPGLDLGGQMRTNFGQNLRGRAAQVMIDGVSLNGSRVLSRQFDSIDPFNIERIEVLSGATAVYGGNATGGIINIITKKGSTGGPRFTSQVGMRSGFHGDGDMDKAIAQSVEGGNDRLFGRLSLAAGKTGGSRDGDGAKVLPDITQTDLQYNQSVDLMGTLDANFGRGGTLSLLGQLYNSEYKPGEALWMQAGAGNNILKPSALDVRSGFSSDVSPATERRLLSFNYHLPEAPGGQDFYLKGFVRSEKLQFYPFPGTTANPLGGAAVPYWSTSTQSTDTWGLKSALNKKWGNFGLTYGVDYDHEAFDAQQTMFNMTTALNSGGLTFQRESELGRYPSFETNIWSGYLQGDWRASDTLSFSGGVRHQRVGITVDPFVQIAQQRLVSVGIGQSAEAIPGGSNHYGVTLYNAGVVWKATPTQQVYANYSEGFELADPAKYYGANATYSLVGGRNGYFKLNRYISVADTSMAAIKTRSTELGWRKSQGPVRAQTALFYSQSDKSVEVNRTDLSIQLADSGVRNYGLEGQVSLDLNSQWSGGVNLLLMRTEEKRNGNWVKRGIYYASPSKLTAFARWQANQALALQLQVSHSLQLNSDVLSFGTASGSETLPSQTLVDLLGHYQTQYSAGVRGTLSFGIQNVFDKTYATRWSEMAKLAYAGSIASNVLDFKGRGRTLSLSYTLDY